MSQRHSGIAGTGVVIDNNDPTEDAVRVRDDYVTVEWLEVKNGSSGVVSHTLQNVDGLVPGAGKVHFSIGVGNGRFSDMPARTQVELGKENATYVFGNASVEVVQDLNIIGEWDGIGLNAGMAYTLPVSGAVLAFSAGVADITEYSSDQPRFIFGAGLAYTIY